MDQVAKQSTVDRIAQANNVLVTVSSNPSVDQLAAAIGLTLFLNKQGKHATAVFSGDVPSTIEFLQPDKTIEKNTNSLRDFIISLDKAKADKLRYKVEDKVVKIFITPYRTSISDKDFEFSEGDFNVDVVMALGVHTKEELDQAIIAHGRILHDATVISINNVVGGNLGTINWQDQQASSLCEMLMELAETIKPEGFDAQMATAFLTGIVAETKRFSNEKTTSRTMSLSAKLMAAGANQQLVASQLQAKSSIAKMSSKSEHADADGTLEIDHESEKKEELDQAVPTVVPAPTTPPAPATPPTPRPLPSSHRLSPIGDVRQEDHAATPSDLFTSPSSAQSTDANSAFSAQAPMHGGTLTANTRPEDLSPSLDPLGPSRDQPLMQRGTLGSAADNNLGDKTISQVEEAVLDQDKTLADIEKTVDSPHTAVLEPTVDLDSFRGAVAEAASQSDDRLEPLEAVAASVPLNVQSSVPASQPLIPADPGLPSEQTGVTAAATAPPPVPPPMTMPVPGPPMPTAS